MPGEDWPEVCCCHRMLGIGKRFVYTLRSGVHPDRHYVGVTSDVGNRLEWHNHGPCGHTAGPRPWSLVVVIGSPPSNRQCASNAT